MEFYEFVRGCLAWTASFTCFLVLLNVPMLYFAHRIREGRLEEDDDRRIDNDELWKRSALGAFALAAASLVFVFVDVVLADWADMPPGIIHFVLFLAYFPATAYLLAIFFAYDDYFSGLGLLTLDLGLPLAVLWILNAITGLWDPAVNCFYQWLKAIPVS